MMNPLDEGVEFASIGLIHTPFCEAKGPSSLKELEALPRSEIVEVAGSPSCASSGRERGNSSRNPPPLGELRRTRERQLQGGGG